MPVAVNFKEFKKAISSEAGLNAIISLTISTTSKDKKPVHVITKDIQYDYISGKVLHVDFQQLSMDEKIEAEVPVELVGESKGVKEEAGILVAGERTVKVKCLPLEIPQHFTVIFHLLPLVSLYR